MALPSFLDIQRIGELALLIAMVIQYIKDKVPEWTIKPYLQLAFGILFSWLGYVYVADVINPVSIPWVRVVVDGVIAALGSDFGYNFLASKSGSPAFSLPARNAPQKTP